MKLIKRLSCFALAAITALGVTGAASAIDVTSFPDYDPNAWHARALRWVVDEGIMVGDGEGKLSPDRLITRAEFVTMVDRLFETYNKADISMFEDVPGDAWYTDYVAMGYQMGTINGTSETTMEPLGTITREQVMTILARALALPDGDMEDLAQFPDRENSSDWSVPYSAALTRIGKVQGRGDGLLHPRELINRAEVAQLLMRCFPHILDGHGDTSGVYKDNVLIRSHDLTSRSVIKGGTYQESLIFAVGMGDGATNIYDSKINRLVCWGNHDVYIWPSVSVKQIVISRTDGPCIIHWMGGMKDFPEVIFRPGSDPGCKVVDKDGKEILPNPPKPSGGGGGGSTHYPVVYFDKQDGTNRVTKRIDSSGYVQPIETPVRSGYVFSGWYTEKECKKRFDFSKKATDGMTLYAKWYTTDEYEEVQRLNSLVAGATVRVQADTDILALVDNQNVPVHLAAHEDNPCGITVKLVLQDQENTVLGSVDLEPGAKADTLLVENMPEYGNYSCKYVVTAENGSNNIEIQAMLYVAYMW